MTPALIAIALAATNAGASDDDAIEHFEKKVRPLLVARCEPCHSASRKKTKGGLSLDAADGWRRGGGSGPAVVPGKPDESLLLKAVRWQDDMEMPPDERLHPDEVKTLEAWIRSGAPDPRSGNAAAPARPPMDLAAGRRYWAFQPVRDVPPPAVRDALWPATDIDRHLLGALEARGLGPATDAPPAALLRRLSFDLLGLPPSPEDLAAFARVAGPQALADTVDSMLASPRFGERWGRHWLDLARFSESSGGGRPFLYPHAWRYRDWVIGAFTADLPYDAFLRAQLAGDLLPAATPAQRRDNLVATTFLMLGPTNYEAQDKELLRMDVVDEQLDTIGKGVLGMTIGCARCHDHKFDPIPIRDYYALAGILRSTRTLVHDNVSKWIEVDLPPDDDLPAPDGQLLRTMTVLEEKQPGPSPILPRGDLRNAGPLVPRGFLSVAWSGPPPEIGADESGRKQLADWIASSGNPLTARVWVNRVWQWLMGEGLVRSVDNFGTSGEPPSHPALLDHLATRFMAEGWSTRRLVRAIVLSRAYRLSSVASARLRRADPDNRLLGRAHRRRLDAEALRDAMLAVSGRLSLEVGGPGVAPGTTAEVGYRFADTRRSVYTPVFRYNLHELFEVFDFADPNLALGRRSRTTTSTQALFMLNSGFVIEEARAAAARLAADAPASPIDEAFVRTLGRSPTRREHAAVRAFVRAPADWALVFQSLFCSLDFRHLS